RASARGGSGESPGSEKTAGSGQRGCIAPMAKLLVIALLVLIGWRLLAGRWPWQPKITRQDRKLGDARRLLGLGPRATREEVQSAHRKLLSTVHPDKGGSSAQVH